MMLEPYPREVEAQMKELYGRLPEKNRRLYAGVEALKFSKGGIGYIGKLLGCSRNTVSKGIKELSKPETLPRNRNRKDGGGRTSTIERHDDINDVFLLVLQEHTAGDPMDVKVKWTNLSCREIGNLLAGKGFNVSRNIVKKLLKNNDYVKRKALKKKSCGAHIDRNKQFENISKLRKLYDTNGNPVISVDTKKRSL